MSKKLALAAMLAVVLGAASQGNATPIAFGQIIDGTTFDTDNAFQFFNNSTGGENIVSLTWNLTPILAFFDTTNASPGFSPSPITLGPSDPVGHTFPVNATLDGQGILTITFTGFAPGEAFRFGVDTDFFASIDGFGLTGDQFVGATATALFSDGNARVGTYVLTDRPGFGSEVDIVIPANPVPEPTSMALTLLGLATLRFMRRKKD